MTNSAVIVRYCSLVLFLWALSGCSVAPVLPQDGYEAMSKQHLSALNRWYLEGRMSISSSTDSWSASVEWQREADEDTIHLSGPFGQGAVIVHLATDEVRIDRGDGQVQYSSEPDLFVKEQLGIFVPVRALRYWVVGLPDPARSIRYLQQGFEQDGWRVEFKQWQSIAGNPMPRKVTVVNDKVKLKLVCDQWVIN